MSEQTTISPCCVTGHIHEGTPLGKIEVVHGLRTYISDPKPPAAGTKQDVVILLPDIFGIDLVNTKLVADEWAGQGNGWKVLLPDVFEGDAIDSKHLNAITPNLKVKENATLTGKAVDSVEAMANLGPFLAKRREAVSKPLVEKYVAAVRAEPTTRKIVAVGYCWGGRYAFLLAQPDSAARVDVAIAYHPSFLTNDDVKPINTVPCAILKGTQDDMMSEEALDEVEKILSANLGDKLLIKRYTDAVHGFSVRGDDNEPREKGFKEDGANVGIGFAKKWLD